MIIIGAWPAASTCRGGWRREDNIALWRRARSASGPSSPGGAWRRRAPHQYRRGARIVNNGVWLFMAHHVADGRKEMAASTRGGGGSCAWHICGWRRRRGNSSTVGEIVTMLCEQRPGAARRSGLVVIM